MRLRRVLRGSTLERRTCAPVTVPMDWRQPDAHADIRIAIAYSRGHRDLEGSVHRQPGRARAPVGRSTSPSVAGAGASRDVHRLRPARLRPARLRRAAATSSCLTTEAKLDTLPEVADRRVRNRSTHAVEVAEAKLFGEACASTEFRPVRQHPADRVRPGVPPPLPGPGTSRAYDKLNYIGYSYGTWLGAWYADTYPTQGRPVHPRLQHELDDDDVRQPALDSFSFQRRRDKMLFPWLARHNSDYGLGKSAKSVKKKYEPTAEEAGDAGQEGPQEGQDAGHGAGGPGLRRRQLHLLRRGVSPARATSSTLLATYAKKPSSREVPADAAASGSRRR